MKHHTGPAPAAASGSSGRLIEMLADIGLSRLEALAYLALLQEPGATAYRVSQMVGKSPPNTYKALDALRAKGAVVVDESSGSRAFSALPMSEYLEGMRRSLDGRQQALERELASVRVEPVDYGVFKLTTAEQVYERCRNMLRAAESVVLLDAFPKPLAELQKEASGASERGVKVFIKAYVPTAVPGCDVLAPAEETAEYKFWNGDWLNLVVDCCESVQSFLKKDNGGVHAAAWTRNRYLAFLDYNGMVSEFVLTRLIQLVRTGSAMNEVIREIKSLVDRYMREKSFIEAVPSSWLTGWKPGADAAGRQKWVKMKKQSKQIDSERRKGAKR